MCIYKYSHIYTPNAIIIYKRSLPKSHQMARMRIYVYMNIYMSTYLDVVNVVTQKWDRTVTEQVQFTTHVVGSYHQMVRLGVATLWQSGTQTWLEKFPASHV